jgi:hypothetical protein
MVKMKKKKFYLKCNGNGGSMWEEDGRQYLTLDNPVSFERTP